PHTASNRMSKIINCVSTQWAQFTTFNQIRFHRLHNQHTLTIDLVFRLPTYPDTVIPIPIDGQAVVKKFEAEVRGEEPQIKLMLWAPWRPTPPASYTLECVGSP